MSETVKPPVQLKPTLKEYEKFFSLSQDMLCIAGTDGYFKKINPSFERILGYSTWELLAKPFLNFIHPDDLEKTKDELMKLESGIPTIHFENRYQCKNGGYKWLSWNSSSADSDGLIYAVAHDITDHKTALEELRKNQAFLDSVVENIPNMIFVKDARELKFIRFNKAGEDLLGYSREDMIGKSDQDFFPKKEADFFTKKDTEVLKGKKLLDIPEEDIQTKHKGERVLHTKKIPLYDQNGEPEYLLGISEDITEAKQAREALMESEEKFRNIALQLEEAQKIANVGSWEYDVESKQIKWSDETYRIFNKKPEEFNLSLEEFRNVIHPDDRDLLTEKVEAAISKGISYEIELRNLRKDGTIKFLTGRGWPVKKHGKVIRIIGTVMDITDRKNAEVKIMKAVVQGQDMERRRIADDLHDSLGQKLSAIQLNFVNIAQEPEKFTERNKEVYLNLQIMLKDVIQEVRNISHNLMPNALSDFGLRHALEDLCSKLSKSGSMKVHFQSHGLKGDIDKSIEMGIYRIAQELINNTVKHAKAGIVEVQIFERENHLILTVEDDGAGFDTEIINFENTFGFNSIMSRTKALNGEFIIESKPGQGVLASVKIPMNHE